MLHKLILISAVLALAADEGRVVDQNRQTADLSCGKDKPPCSEDRQCVPQKDDCTDLSSCPGNCTFKNEYKSCGAFRGETVSCDDDSECVDDPRVQGETCGMACDMPGICAPKTKPRCGGIIGFICPEGLYCYYPETGPCVPSKGGKDCLGFCM